MYVYLITLSLLFCNVLCNCPNGYVIHDESCYKLFGSTKATWAEAYMYCQLFNSDLVVIESSREQNFLEGFLRREFKPGMSDGVWVGGTDSIVEGDWRWAKTDMSIKDQQFQHWYPGEPNSMGNVGEDCMDLLHHENYNWNDERCEVQNNFVCEKSAQSGEQIIG